MKYHISIFVLSLLCVLFQIAVEHLWEETAKVSLSLSLSLADCADKILELKKKSLRIDLANYLLVTIFEGYSPKVCCGTLSDILVQAALTKQQRKLSKVYPRVDYVFKEDSYPTARNKCGIDTNGDRIFGGAMTELDEFPWMALLGYKLSNSSKFTYQCGGALINQRYVLTAAHCVVGDYQTKYGELTTVRLGEYDLQTDVDCSDGVCAEPVQKYAVQSAHPNPGYSDQDRNRQHDIALLRLAKRARLSYYVQPICLMDSSLSLDIGNEVHVAGWGLTFNDGHLCAGGVFGEDTCEGDSGGPLMRKLPSGIWEVIAVVSFGNGCGREGWPAVYTSIASYSKWIQKTMRYTNKKNTAF